MVGLHHNASAKNNILRLLSVLSPVALASMLVCMFVKQQAASLPVPWIHLKDLSLRSVSLPVSEMQVEAPGTRMKGNCKWLIVFVLVLMLLFLFQSLAFKVLPEEEPRKLRISLQAKPKAMPHKNIRQIAQEMAIATLFVLSLRATLLFNHVELH